MHLNCPHCRNPIEVVDDSVKEVLCPSCGSSFHLAETKTTVEFRPAEHGQMFGRFVVQEKVGMGAFGTVYRAVDGDLHRTVAVKVPRTSNIGSSADGIDRFLREARSAAQLRHPSIVTVHEVGVQNDQPYLVSDYVDGVTLADWLTAHQPTFRQAAQWIADLAEALHYAHTQGVIHRDVKPSNVILAKSANSSVLSAEKTQDSALRTQHLYLMDFGLAKRDAGEITMTMEGQLLGTPAYMSPEQAKGQGHQVDGRADEYSLGVMLYELLAGELPFRGNVRMLLDQVMHDEPKPPRKINDRIPLDLETICLKAMAKEPGRRYGDCGQLAADLKRYLNEEPITARPVGNLERTWRWCKRNPMVAGLTFAVCLSLLGGLLITLIYAQRLSTVNSELADAVKTANERGSKIRSEIERYQVTNGFRQIENGDYYLGMLWFTGPLAVKEPSPREDLHRMRLSAFKQHRVTTRLIQQIEHHERVSAVMFSPDGRFVVTGSADQTAQVWDVASGKAVTPPLPHPAGVTHASFSPDSRSVLTACSDGTVNVWDAVTGKTVFAPIRHLNTVTAARFSADGRLIVTASNDRVARVWNATNGIAVSPPLVHQYNITNAELSPDGLRIMTSCDDRKVRVWESVSGKPITFVLQHPVLVTYATLSPDGRQLMTICDDYTVRIWDANNGQSLLPALQQRNSVRSATYCPDGTRIVTICHDNTAEIWDILKGHSLGTPLQHQGLITAATFSPDSRQIVTTSEDKTARIWDATSGQPVSCPLYHQDIVVRATFSPDGRSIATASFDKTSRIWSGISTQSASFPTIAHSAPPFVALSADGKLALTTNSNKKYQVFDTTTGLAISPSLHEAYFVQRAAFSPDGSRLITISGDNYARVWNVSTAQELTPPLKHQNILNNAVFDPEGRKILTSCLDGTISVWDASNGKTVLPEFNHSYVDQAEFSPDGRRIFTYSRTALRIWDAASGSPVSPSIPHRLTLSGRPSFTTDNNKVLIAGTVSAQVWDVTTGKPLSIEFGTSNNRVSTANISSDGTRVVFVSNMNEVQVWNAIHGAPITPVIKHQSSVWYVSFSPDGTRFVTANDRTARIWNAVNGQAMTPPLAHQDQVIHAAFSHDGKQVATLGRDQTVRVWDTESGQPLAAPLRCMSEAVASPENIVSFSPDCSRIMVRSTGVIQEKRAQDGRMYLTTRYGSISQVWSFAKDSRPVRDVVRLAQLNACQKVDETGGLLSLDKEIVPWFQELKTKYPTEFAVTYAEGRQWRLKQIADCAWERNLSAALFHQNWLLAEAIAEAANRKR